MAPRAVCPGPHLRFQFVLVWGPKRGRTGSRLKQRARKQELSQVNVHKSDGNMEDESTYGEEPQP